MIRRTLCTAAVAAAVAFPLKAGAQPMNLVDAVSYALSHNPTVAQQRASLASAENALAKARGNAFPLVNGSLQNISQKSANYGGQFQAIGVAQKQVFSQNTAQLGTTYTLQSGGLSFYQLTTAREQTEQARQTLANTENQLATSITNAYFAVLQKRAIVTLDQSDLNYQNVLVEVSKAKERAGVSAGVDVLRAQVAQAKSASALVGAQADVQNSIESLALAAGAPIDTAFEFPAQIADPKLPSQEEAKLETIALQARPDVHAAQESLSAAQSTRKGWNRELFPQSQIAASFGNQFSPTNQNFIIGPNGQPIIAPRVGTAGFWLLSATSTFTLPFVDYGQRHSERVSDDAAVASAELALNQATTQVRVDVRQSYRSAQTALAQVAYARDEARLGTESARVAQLQYQHGLITLSDVLQTQQQSVSAQADFVNARVSYVDAVVKLRVSLGIYDARSAVADLR